VLHLSPKAAARPGLGPAQAAPAGGCTHGSHHCRYQEPTSLRYALRRLGFFILTLWAALTLNFLLPRLMPGNPALAMLSKFHGELSPKALNALEILFGVNSHESLISQYFGYLHQILTGNLGTSLDEYP